MRDESPVFGAKPGVRPHAEDDADFEQDDATQAAPAHQEEEAQEA